MSKERYRLITEYPKDEFFDNKQVVKFDSYEVIRTLNQQADKIADLEAKLAESEKQRQHLKDWLDDEILTSVDHESYYATINEYEEEVKKLKQQLAEKDKEIKELLNYDRCSHCSYGQANKEYRERCSELIEELAEVKNSCDYYMNRANDLLLKDQDKISFAVEQLEETKKLIANLDMPDSPVLYNDDMFQAGFDSHYVRTRQTIDNKIKQLKEGK